MRDNDFNNILENNNDESDFIIPMEAACSDEFSVGCIFCDED